MLKNIILCTALLSAASCTFQTEPEKELSEDAGGICSAYEDAGFQCVSIWVQDDEYLPPYDILAGCALWEDTGLKCVIVDDDDRDDADIKISSNEKECVPHEDGSKTCAMAFSGGAIISYTKCVQNEGGTLNIQLFRKLMGHEIGHLIGIWDHVPRNCDEPEVKHHDDGPAICGPALMNALLGRDVDGMTGADWLAYDMRDTEHSFIDQGSEGDLIDEVRAEPDAE